MFVWVGVTSNYKKRFAVYHPESDSILVPDVIKTDPSFGIGILIQCCGSGFVSTRYRYLRIRILLSSSKNSKKTLDPCCFATFVTSL
jgi:hypothetical protein